MIDFDDERIAFTKAQLGEVMGQVVNASNQATATATVKALRDAGWLREVAGEQVTVKRVERNEQGQITTVIETTQR